MTPLSVLGLTAKALDALARHDIQSVEALGDLTPERVRQIMPYCHAMCTLAQFRHWFNRRYPSPPSKWEGDRS